MSSGIVEKEKVNEVKIDIRSDLDLEYLLSKIIVPFTHFLDRENNPDIYTDEKTIPFEQKHPNFKALMLTEFEDVIRDFSKIIKRKK